MLRIEAQLGFCSGNSGDPIFTETFGTGTTNNRLPAGTTTYTFVTGTPSDGFYTVSNRSNFFDWHDVPDHTPNDTNGKMLIINASFTADEFYRTTISGLCENTSYEFSAWMINLLPSVGCGGAGIPINVKFQIWDNSDTNLLASGDTGSIQGTSSPNWENYALVFQTLPGQTSVILKMINNGNGGCGNDLAIDDILFKTCGDRVIIEDTTGNTKMDICETDVPITTELTAVPDFLSFSTHFYQWQESTDGINWTDISGETGNNFTTPLIYDDSFYRVKIAEDAINVDNSLCNTISETYAIRISELPEAPISNGDLQLCENDVTPLTVTVPSRVTVDWFDAPINGNLVQSNSLSYSPNGVSGTYYAEAVTILGDCRSTSRTAVNVAYSEIPVVTDEQAMFCENEGITIHANSNINTVTYLWNTGETTEEILVTSPGIYTVIVTNDSCSVTKTVEVEQIDNPIIERVESDGRSVVVYVSNSGNFEYSLDGVTFQTSPIFNFVEGGLYTIYVKEANCNELITIAHLHFYIPKYFTPNNDGINDTFDLKGIEFYASSKVHIFNRYGKLLKSSQNAPFVWNGTLAGDLLPSDDYWYIIEIDGQKFMGHFTLKR